MHESSLGELVLAGATLEATLEALPDAVIVVDPDGQIVSKNPFGERVLKATGGENASSFRELPMPSAVLNDVNEVLQKGNAGDRPLDLSKALSVPMNGRLLKMHITVAPIPDFFPRRAGAAIVLADVTEFARLDDLRGEVVAIASHELKTPLTSLQMNHLLLQENADNLTARQREILAAAVRGGHELGATIDELLDLTRIEAGQLRLADQQVDLAAVVDQVASSLSPRFDDGKITLQIIKDAPKTVVRADPARMRLVFVNLLTNSLKYTPPGGRVTVRFSSMQNMHVDGCKAGQGCKSRH